MSNKYQNAKIYKLTGGGFTYIGSTTLKYLSQRMCQHRCPKNKTSSKQIVCFPDCQITLIETFPCQSKDELRARERYWIENTECVNKNIPGRTRDEWIADNSDYFLNWRQANPDYQIDWFKNNREKWNNYQREYRQRKKSEKQTINTQPAEILSSPL
jgi:hypothetical protein